MTDAHLDALELIVRHFSTAVTPIQLCPLPLFAEIIRINHLRTRPTRCPAARLSEEALEIIERIQSFSPERWAASKASSRESWALVGGVYQSAVALYCVLSLQSAGVLPTSSSLGQYRQAHALHLETLLPSGLLSPSIKRFMIWPLVLLGVEAVHGSAATRSFVAKALPELSRDVGTFVPLTAKRVLEAFWSSGETRWDACFDRAYVFTTQIAVDTSRIIMRPELEAVTWN